MRRSRARFVARGRGSRSRWRRKTVNLDQLLQERCEFYPRFFSARSPQHSGCTSLDELHSKYPNHMDDLCENCYEVWFEKLRNSLIECGMMKRVTVEPLGTKQRQQVDPSPRLDPPGTAVWEVLRQVLPQDEEKERAFVRGFISFFLSNVSKETDARYMDSVNACDPSKVAAQLESVLFENWGFNEQSRN